MWDKCNWRPELILALISCYLQNFAPGITPSSQLPLTLPTIAPRFFEP